MGGDDHRCPRFVELDEQPQQALRQVGIDVAGRLVGEQKLWPRDHGAGDRRALLLAAREHRRQRPDALPETDPAQQLHHLVAEALFAAPEHAERQRDVLVGGQVVEQPEVLEDEADAPPQRRERILAEHRDVVPEQRDQPARRLERQEQEPQQRGLAGA